MVHLIYIIRLLLQRSDNDVCPQQQLPSPLEHTKSLALSVFDCFSPGIFNHAISQNEANGDLRIRTFCQYTDFYQNSWILPGDSGSPLMSEFQVIGTGPAERHQCLVPPSSTFNYGALSYCMYLAAFSLLNSCLEINADCLYIQLQCSQSVD